MRLNTFVNHVHINVSLVTISTPVSLVRMEESKPHIVIVQSVNTITDNKTHNVMIVILNVFLVLEPLTTVLLVLETEPPHLNVHVHSIP